MTMLDSMPEISNLQVGGRGTSKPITYGGDYAWEKPSRIEGMNNRDCLFHLAIVFYNTKDVSKWAKESNETKETLAKLFSAMQGNTHYSKLAVRQQINYAKQALQGKATGSVHTVLGSHASAVRLGLYAS